MEKAASRNQVESKNSKKQSEESKTPLERTLATIMENFSFYLTVLIVMYFIMIVREIYDFHAKIYREGGSFEYQELWYLPITFAIDKLIIVLCPIFLTDFYKQHLTEGKNRGETEEKRLTRLTTYTSNIIYYTNAFLVGIWLTRGTDLLPVFLGGELDNSQFIYFWPKDIPKVIRIFFIFQFSHHFGSLLTNLMYKRQTSDFYTMNFHHFLCIFLMITSYFMRQLHYGVPVLIINDMSEAFLNTTKLFREIKPLKKFFVVSFLLLWSTWVYSRIFSYTLEILKHLKDLLVKPSDAIKEFQYAFLFQVISLHLLGVLNFYWFFMISKLLYNKIVGGVDKNHVEGETDKEKED